MSTLFVASTLIDPQVLDDNPFDRLCELRQRPQTDSAGVGGASIGLPGAQEPHRQVGGVGAWLWGRVLGFKP